MGKRNLYLNNTPVEEAKALYQKALGELLSPKAEWIPVTESLHRITKEAVYAKYCSPLYNAAAMDGIAVEAEKTKGASDRVNFQQKKQEWSFHGRYKKRRSGA